MGVRLKKSLAHLVSDSVRFKVRSSVYVLTCFRQCTLKSLARLASVRSSVYAEKKLLALLADILIYL